MLDNISQYLPPIIVNLIRYFVLAGIPFLILYILFPQKFLANKIQSQIAKQKDFIREIFQSVQASIIIGIVAAIFIFSPLKDHTLIYTNIDAFPIWWIPLSVLLALFVHDTYFYWIHRTVHHPRLYKTIHLMHHKSVNPSPWAAYSFHFTEAIIEALIIPVLIFLMPMHPIALASFGFLSFIINVYGHLGFEVAPKWFRHTFLFEVVNTSVHHNLHHEKFRGNYGLYFRFWDRLMGTENPNYVQEFDQVQDRRFGTKHQLPDDKSSSEMVL